MTPDDVPECGASDAEILACLERLTVIGEDVTGANNDGAPLDATWALARFADLHFRRVLQLARLGHAASRGVAA